MAVIGQSYFDLIDLYNRQDPKGDIAPVIEMLTQMNPMLQEALTVECNKSTTHLHTVRTGLPEVAWGALYKGIPQGKSRTAQVEDTTGFVEGMSAVDKRLLELSKNPGAVRLSEAQAYLESINQAVASRLIYGNTASDPEEFLGLAPRFNDLSAPNGKQIVDAGGTGDDNTSIWFVTWGDNQCHLLHPQGTTAGVKREDKGEQMVQDANGNNYFAMMEMFSWHVGLAVKDWRYVSRIANIDVSDMKAGSVKLYDHMRTAYYRLHNRRVAGGRLAIYANTDVLECLDALATNAGASDNFVRLSRKEIAGEEVLTYRGIPIRETDAILNTEARVV